MYETRKEAADACKYEAAAAERFSTAAIRKASEGQCSAAWRLADQARMAARCAMQAHEALWALVGEDMTEAEFDAFEKAEIAQVSAGRAERAAAAAVEKLNATQHGLPRSSTLSANRQVPAPKGSRRSWPTTQRTADGQNSRRSSTSKNSSRTGRSRRFRCSNKDSSSVAEHSSAVAFLVVFFLLIPRFWSGLSRSSLA